MSEPRRQQISYDPSRVSWATNEFINQRPLFAARLFLYSLVASGGGLLLYASLAQIAISIDTRGLLVSESPAIPLRVPVALRVARLEVHENQEVKKGEVLLVSEDQLSAGQYQHLSGQVAQLQALLAKVDTKTCHDCSGRLNALAKDLFVIDKRSAIDEQFTPVRELLGTLAAALGQYEALEATTSSARRQIELNAKKLAEIKRRGAEQILAQQIEMLTSETVQARNLIADKRQAAEADVARASSRLAVRLTSFSTQLELYRTQQNIIAPADGLVTRLKASGPGEMLSAGAVAMEILPGGASLLAQLAVANRDISQVRAGMEVTVRLDALPEREFGVVRGSVVAVPVDVTAGDAQNAGTYKVLVQLARQSLSSKGVVYPFRLGMALDGLIVTRHESMLAYAVRRLFNLAKANQ